MMRGVPVLPTVGPLATAPLQPGRLVEFCDIDEPLACPGDALGATPDGVGLLTTPGRELGATPDGVVLLITPGADGLATAPLGCPPVLALGPLPAVPAELPALPPAPLLDCACANEDVVSNVMMMRAVREFMTTS